MHNCAVRAGPRNRREAEVAEVLPFAAERFQPVAGGDFGKSTIWRLAREPSEEARQRRAVAVMRCAGAVDFGGVLARLRQQAGVGGAMNLRSRLCQPVEYP